MQNFWGDKQRALWYVMIFSEVVNCFDEVLKIKKGPTIQFTQFTDNKVKLFSLTDKENLIC